jgi:solute carrier family 12 sodium/potassium/chloride transporter 2
MFVLQIVVLSGPPSDRPCLVDFANLITKRLSLLECVHIVKDTTDWKKVEVSKAKSIQWLNEQHIKAFYSISRHASFAEGARSSLEMSGLGKMRPNMMLIGFKDNWRTSLKEARDYYRVIKSAFEIRLAVGVLRIPGGGLDLSMDDSHISASKSHASVDSGLDEDRLQSTLQSQTPPLSIQNGSDVLRKISVLSHMSRKEKPVSSLINSNGREINNSETVKRMTQFRSEVPEEGFVDVYWLYDDGGLTLLMPYILTTR